MKKNLLKFVIGLLAVTALAGCEDNSSSSGSSQDVSSEDVSSEVSSEEPSSEEPVVLTKEEFDIAVHQISTVVPLVIDIVTGDPIFTNERRKQGELPIPELKDGNNLKLIKSGTLMYEDDENEIYLYPDYTISWSFLEMEGYATFQFEEQGQFTLALPAYPLYLEGERVPAKIAGRLTANITIGERSKKINTDVILVPQAIIEEYTLQEVRGEASPKQVIKVKGYVHGIYADYNAAGIADGEWGFALYKVTEFKEQLQIGNLVEATGEFTTYNGLSQVQFLKEIKVLNPENFPEIKRPTMNTFTMDDLYETIEDGWPGTPTNVLFARDNSISTFNAPFKFLRVVDRDGKEVGFEGFDTTGLKHTNVILEATNSNNYKFEVTLSINYHMGGAEQTLIRDWLQANQAKDIYYRGPLSAYNKFTLEPYSFAGHFANEPFTA